MRRLLHIVTVLASADHPTETGSYLERLEREEKARRTGATKTKTMLTNLLRGLNG